MAKATSAQSAPNQNPIALSANERLLLTLLRRRGEAPKADLARLSGLSPTAVSGIIRQLEGAGLVRRGAPQKGRVGQPSVPYSLEPDGACALGLKIGRRSAELVRLDAQMRVAEIAEIRYAAPRVADILAFAGDGAEALLRSPRHRARCCGVGVATPSEMWRWAGETGAPAADLLAWRDVDLASALGARIGAPVHALNDGTAACAAEIARAVEIAPDHGAGAAGPPSVVYFFVGWFIGGGVAIGGRVLEGGRGNAGALGSMLVSDPDAPAGAPPRQLLHVASLYRLEQLARAAGWRATELGPETADWEALGPALDAWIHRAAAGIAQAVAGAQAVFDFDRAVIDGAFPAEVRARLVAQVQAQFAQLDNKGLSPFRLEAGAVGRNARAIGAACAPLMAAFAASGPLMAEAAPFEPAA